MCTGPSMAAVPNRWFDILLCLAVIGNTSTTDFVSSESDRWSPVLVKRNTTRDWNVLAKGQTSSSFPSAQTILEPSVAESTRRILVTSPETVNRQFDPMNPHYRGQDFYDEVSPSPNHVSRYDPSPEGDGYYYPPPYGPGHHSPPIYRPPPHGPSPFPDESVRIELAFDRLVIRCVAHSPLEHIVWTRYPCPNEYFYGNGLPVADGSVVHNIDLYDIRIVGEKGDTSSELLLKSPLDPSTSGLYVCEAWPHYKKPGDGYGPFPSPYYPSLSDAFVVGGSELIDHCYYGQNAPYPQRPFPFKNRQDDRLDDDADTKTKLIKKPPGRTASLADVMRKPRNTTRSAARGRNQNITGENVTEKSIRKFDYAGKLSYRPAKEPRYDFRFDNETILNASANDVFDNFNSIAPDRRLPTRTARQSPFNFTKLPDDLTTEGYKFLIERMKFVNESKSNYNDANRTFNNGSLNWQLLSNISKQQNLSFSQ